MNHYETLGIGRDATPEQIKKAHRKLSSRNHPDKGGENYSSTGDAIATPHMVAFAWSDYSGSTR